MLPSDIRLEGYVILASHVILYFKFYLFSYFVFSDDRFLSCGFRGRLEEIHVCHPHLHHLPYQKYALVLSILQYVRKLLFYIGYYCRSFHVL